jgi:hypothetical protein
LKDNTGSSAIGPFLRLFNATFTLDDVRRAEVDLRVEGGDQFVLKGSSSMKRISRDPAAMAARATRGTVRGSGLLLPPPGRPCPPSSQNGASSPSSAATRAHMPEVSKKRFVTTG